MPGRHDPFLTDAEYSRMSFNAVELVDHIMVITRGLDEQKSGYYKQHELLDSACKAYGCVHELLYLDLLRPTDAHD